jgi:multisubunit Na+/H+ antiporter MnhF subunit
MIATCITICLVLLAAAALLALHRVIVGPTVLDRIVGFDMVAICIVGMVVLLSVLWDTDLFIELMLIFSLLGFVGTVAFVSYLQAESRAPHAPTQTAANEEELKS